MIASARLTFGRKYFELHYDEWIRHRSKLKKYELWYAAAIIAFGVVLTALYFDRWHMGVVIVAFGAYKFRMSSTSRRRWVEARLRAVRGNKEVEITFESDRMLSKSDRGASEILLEALSEFTLGSHGFFIVPENGVSIYVPRSAIKPSDSYDALTRRLSSAIAGES